MGQVRHGSATTTHAVRAAIQRSQASLTQLSRELGINPKTVAKGRKRATVEDTKTGPKVPRSTVLTEEDEAAVVAFRRHTELAVHLVPRARCLVVRDSCPVRLPSDNVLNTHALHQPCDSAAGNMETLAAKLPPDLPHAVDPPFLFEDRGISGPGASSRRGRSDSRDVSARFAR